MDHNVVLRLEGVWKTFGTHAERLLAVKGASLEIHRGEVAMILGPSGSGKTTLLSIMGLLLYADAGEVYLTGREVAELPETKRSAIRRRRIGFVFQDFKLLPSMTAVENVEIAAQIRGLDGSDARQRAKAILTEVGLGARLHFLPNAMSPAEKQRVAIARALVNDPPVILADEPTGDLDADSGAETMALLRHFARMRGCAVVIATHDQRIREYADVIYNMEDGRLSGPMPGQRAPTPPGRGVGRALA
ncbi:MAG: ABC transporter ATP-binding protein [Euryarchaeota archaeon]|nr:ABC transporter ATP-binding protein [Euryarchaeota archaeon]